MRLIPDQMLSKLASYFTRSTTRLKDSNKVSGQVAPDRNVIGSRVHLQGNGAPFELRNQASSQHSEGTM